MESFVVKPVKPYIAPTWSWASCEGEIDFHHRRWWHNHLEALCRVNEITLTYVSATNKFGQLRHAALILTGPIFHVTHIDEEDEFLHGDTWSNETHGYPVLNEPEGDAGKLQGRMKLRRMHAVFDETPAIQSRKDLSYLIILARTAPRGPFSWKSHCGLILKPAGDESNPNHFVRIGIFTVEDDGHAPTDRAHYKMFTVTLV